MSPEGGNAYAKEEGVGKKAHSPPHQPAVEDVRCGGVLGAGAALDRGAIGVVCVSQCASFACHRAGRVRGCGCSSLHPGTS